MCALLLLILSHVKSNPGEERLDMKPRFKSLFQHGSCRSRCSFGVAVPAKVSTCGPTREWTRPRTTHASPAANAQSLRPASLPFFFSICRFAVLDQHSFAYFQFFVSKARNEQRQRHGDGVPDGRRAGRTAPQGDIHAAHQRPDPQGGQIGERIQQRQMYMLILKISAFLLDGDTRTTAPGQLADALRQTTTSQTSPAAAGLRI